VPERAWGFKSPLRHHVLPGGMGDGPTSDHCMKCSLSTVCQRDLLEAEDVGGDGGRGGLRPGDWATWVGSAAVCLSLFVLAHGTTKQARETARQAYLDESSQARLIGATLDLAPATNGDGTVCLVNLINASPLPVRQVAPFVMTAEVDSELCLVQPVDILQPGPGQTGVEIPGHHMNVVLVLTFQDDAGCEMEKVRLQ
jgi:hypothetical protein